MKYLVICIFILICLNNCTKIGKNMTVKGRVMNPITGEGIPDIPIELQRTTKGLPGGFKTVKTIYTNENGNFEISKGGIDTYYLLVENLGNYYRIGWHTQGEEQGILGNKIKVKKRKVMHADYYAAPYGNLILNINNVNCSGAGDVMNFHKKWVGFTDFENSYSSPREGCYSYTSPYPFQIPIGTYVYETKVVRSGITSFVYDTVTVAETGVSTINIEY